MARLDIQSSEELGRQIRELRRGQKLTQAQLAGFANTGLRFIGDLEKGKGTCHIGKMLRVLSALGVELIIRDPYEKE